jgi:hypothetical protein
MKIKNYQITEEELMDMGRSEYPDLVITDEVLNDLARKGVNAK